MKGKGRSHRDAGIRTSVSEPVYPAEIMAEPGWSLGSNALLRAANGEESGLTGVPPEYAAKLLTQWGYPTSMDALSADEWEQRISANAMQLNPLDLLGGY